MTWLHAWLSWYCYFKYIKLWSVNHGFWDQCLHDETLYHAPKTILHPKASLEVRRQNLTFWLFCWSNTNVGSNVTAQNSEIVWSVPSFWQPDFSINNSSNQIPRFHPRVLPWLHPRRRFGRLFRSTTAAWTDAWPASAPLHCPSTSGMPSGQWSWCFRFVMGVPRTKSSILKMGFSDGNIKHVFWVSPCGAIAYVCCGYPSSRYTPNGSRQ